MCFGNLHRNRQETSQRLPETCCGVLLNHSKPAGMLHRLPVTSTSDVAWYICPLKNVHTLYAPFSDRPRIRLVKYQQHFQSHKISSWYPHDSSYDISSKLLVDFPKWHWSPVSMHICYMYVYIPCHDISQWISPNCYITYSIAPFLICSQTAHL